MMKRILASALAVGFAVLTTNAADPPAAPKTAAKGSFADLKADFEKAMENLQKEREKAVDAAKKASKAERDAAEKALEEAKTDDEKKAAQERLKKAKTPPEMPESVKAAQAAQREFSKKFLQFAEQNPTDPAAFESITLALKADAGPFDASGNWTPIMKFLKANFATKDEIRKLVPGLASLDDESVQELVREVMAKHPNRMVQAKAYKALAAGLGEAAETGKQIKESPKMREKFEKMTSKAYAERIISRIDRNTKESEALKKTMIEKYSDIIPDLSIGKIAPEVKSQDVDGKEVKLSSLKGKVVVLDIWATWCGPCRAMIPHEREMVERLKDKPFVLVGISADDDRKTLTDFLAKEKMPWTHWWSGPETGIVDEWDIDGFPTIFVLDAKGTIRYRDLRGKELEEAVVKLLEEMEGKDAKPK